MKFTPKPENPFPEFIRMYYDRCRAACPKLRAIAGKWTFEDLIPGLSDFDTRLIFDDDVTVREWADMSLAVGTVHTQLARKVPAWARILEHLPGLNLMRRELTDPVSYYPEFQQWTYYLGDSAVIDSILGHLRQRPWTTRDEQFHLKKFASYFGPYDRAIDPPVNLGPFENKYPLHSRFMHYFTPPVQSAVAIVQRQAVAGKAQALRLARGLFPHPDVIDMILETVDRHYETPAYYAEPELTNIEQRLEAYLRGVYQVLADHVTLIRIDPADSPQAFQAKLSAVPVDPVESFFGGIKFGRFMKGRLLFFAEPIAWFDSRWLIRIELGRIVPSLYDLPLRIYGQLRFREPLPPEEVLRRIEGSVLAPDVVRAVREFAALAVLPVAEGEEKKRAYEVAQVFEPVQMMVETLAQSLYSEIAPNRISARARKE